MYSYFIKLPLWAFQPETQRDGATKQGRSLTKLSPTNVFSNINMMLSHTLVAERIECSPYKSGFEIRCRSRPGSNPEFEKPISTSGFDVR